MSTREFKTVVFVCTGNYYRSRYCECFFNALARKHELRWRATSRGLRASSTRNEGPISRCVVKRLTEMDIPVDAKRGPMQLVQADLESTDLVVALKKAEHHAMMTEQFPNWADRIEYWHVDDLDCATVEEALPVCEERVESLVKELLAEQQAPARERRVG